jgi:transcriptional regulator with XRE-family HTH domain
VAVERNVLLKDFLRARRSGVSPSSAGLHETGSRRVAGLRREEVAMLAGMSVDYYTRLEQGRDISPSESVLDAIARVLQLTPAQRTQLYALVRDRGRTMPPEAADPIRPTALQLLGALSIPAIIVGRGTAVIASNAAHQALTVNFSQEPPERRYYAYWLFAEPAAQALLVDWARSARETAGILRTAVTRFPDDERLRELVHELSTLSPEFRELWSEFDVEAPSSGEKNYRHPIAGELTLMHEVAQLSDEHWIHMYWAEPGSASERALSLIETSEGGARRPPSAR